MTQNARVNAYKPYGDLKRLPSGVQDYHPPTLPGGTRPGLHPRSQTETFILTELRPLRLHQLTSKLKLAGLTLSKQAGFGFDCVYDNCDTGTKGDTCSYWDVVRLVLL